MMIIYAIVAVLLIGQLVCLLVLISKYSSSPEKMWKSKVLNSVSNINAALTREQFSYDSMNRSHELEVDQLRSNALNRILQQMPVELLADYPGIGPSTVEKLHYSGFRTIHDIHTRSINIHGIGDKRLSDIRVGSRQLYQQAISTLEKSTSAEHQQLNRAIAAIHQAYTEKSRISEARLNAVKKVCEIMREAVATANKITFWGFVRSTNRSHLSDRLRNFGFPNLEATLEKAEAKAKRQEKESEEKTLPFEMSAAPAKPVIQPLRNVPPPKPVPPSVDRKLNTFVATQKLDTKPRTPPEPPCPALSPFEELMQAPSPPHLPVRSELESIPFQTVDLAQVLMEIAVELGYLIARADGRLAQAEQQMIEGYLDSRYHTDVAMHTKAQSLSAHFAKASIVIQPLIERIKKHCNAEAIQHLMGFAKEVALAGNLNEKKDHLYQDIGKRLGLSLASLQAVPVVAKPPLPPKPVEKVIAPPPANTQSKLLQSLEISDDQPLSADLIRRQFNKLADRFQSNKIAHLGADFELLAEQRYTAARQAAEQLLQEMGEPLVITEKPAEPVGIRENKELDELFGE